MTREEMKAYFEASSEVLEALKGLPFRDAAVPIGALLEMGELVGQSLPGGYFGECPHCEEVKGQDEMVDFGDERICRSCADRWNAAVTSEKPE